MKNSLKGPKKRKLFFVLDDVLSPGRVVAKLDSAKTAKLLPWLSSLQDKGVAELFIVTGHSAGVARKKISDSNMDRFFWRENILMVDNEYLGSKTGFDRERYDVSIAKDAFFVDEYFKHYAIMRLVDSGRVKRSESVLIGHDIWFDAFYTLRFPKIDFVLVDTALSERNIPIRQKPAWLETITFSETDFEKLLVGNFPRTNPKLLESYVFEKMGKELLSGTDFSGLARKALERRSIGDSVFAERTDNDTNK